MWQAIGIGPAPPGTGGGRARHFDRRVGVYVLDYSIATARRPNARCGNIDYDCTRRYLAVPHYLGPTDAGGKNAGYATDRLRVAGMDVRHRDDRSLPQQRRHAPADNV
jgi:hypothetical protein